MKRGLIATVLVLVPGGLVVLAAWGLVRFWKNRRPERGQE